MNPENRPDKPTHDSNRYPNHPFHKQEKALVAVCIVVAGIMLLSLSRYMFR